MTQTFRICLLLAILFLSGFTIARSQEPPVAACTPTPIPTPRPIKSNSALPPGAEADRRRLAPTVGTGGAIGGPTGLFTIYDGQTLKWKESTFSVALSNFDRDPGNVDITEVPYSVQTGLSDNIEFFSTNVAYRAIRVNNPQNLSSFYLPNTSLPFGFRGPAIVLAPLNNQGVTGPLFRPANNQPFVAFPFVNQPSGNFGNVTFSGTLGVQNTGLRLFGGASNFPGIGSAYGSLLPGVVLSLTPAGLPATRTLAPSYLPDAPFISQRYGQSTFVQTTLGLKIRLPFSTRNTGMGLVPFYRFYRHGASDAAGFNQLQRGASPGSTFGDVGLVGFVDHRFTKYLNVAVNLGYIFNSNPRSQAFGANTATLLDRPNELSAGIGFDFTVKKYMQLITEARSTTYVGGHTPNSFGNNPVELISGARFYFSDSIGLGLAYRLHVNQQSAGRFNGSLPTGFVPSSNPNGFIAQFWFGRHFPRYKEKIFKPEVKSDFTYTLTLACPPNRIATSGSCPSCAMCTTADPKSDPCFPSDTFDGRYITLRALPDRVSSDRRFVWTTEPGTPDVEGAGQKVRWDVSALPLNRKFLVRVDMADSDGKNPGTKVWAITVVRCPICEPICPTINVTPSAGKVDDGSTVTFDATLTTGQGTPYIDAATYEWNITGGKIVGSQNGPSLTVDTSGITDAVNRRPVSLVATVIIGGLDASCPKTATAQTTVVVPPIIEPECKLFDTYGAIKYNDEKARLDNFAIQLKEPGVEGYIIAYRGLTNPLIENIGTSRLQVLGDVCADYRFSRAVDYLVNDRGIDRSRIHYIDGGDRKESSVDLWICPANETPAATSDPDVAHRPGPCISKGIPIKTKKGKGAQPKRKVLPAKH
jgi:hypothetical protein